MKKPAKKFLQSLIAISYGMTAKMKDILSISTNCQNCSRCIHRHGAKLTLKQIKHIIADGGIVSICRACFAFNVTDCYKTSLLPAIQRNTDILTARLLSVKELKALAVEIVQALIKNGTDQLRLESFGDLQNELQAINYLKLCVYIKRYSAAVNYRVLIALWTKNFDYLLNGWDHLSNNEKKDCRAILSVLISSVFINLPVSDKIIEKIENHLKMKIKVFTVYSDSTRAKINCGAKCCKTCRACYEKRHKTVFINELLK